MVTPLANQTCAELNAVATANSWPMRCDGTLAFEESELQALHTLWNEKAAGGVPPRSAFDLRSLRPFAKHILILERKGTGTERRYRFRLFGSAHMFLFGDHTGRYLDEMVSSDLLPSWLAFYDAILTTQQPLRIVTRFRIPSGAFLESEIFAAPMLDDAGLERLILAATFVDLHDIAPSPLG